MMRGKTLSTLLKFALAAAIVAVGTGVVTSPGGREAVRSVLVWARELGPLGPIVLFLCYVVAAIFLVPGSLLTVGGSLSFGFSAALIAVFFGSNLGAILAFLLGRGVARSWIERRMAGNEKFLAIDKAIGEKGFQTVLWLRLSPLIPFNLLNYALGLTRVRLRDYVLATVLGMLPGMVLFLYIGLLVRDVSRIDDVETAGGESQPWIFYVGLALTLMATLAIARIARNALMSLSSANKSAA